MRRTYSQLLIFLSSIAAITVFNPVAGVDAFLVGLALLVTGHILLKEKLLFVFLILRPILDYWREFHIFTYQHVDINVNAALSMLFALWLAWMLIIHRKEILHVPGIILGTGTLVIMTGSVLYSHSPMTSLVESMKFFATLGFFVVSFISIKKKKFTLYELGAATALMAVIPLLAGLLQLVGQSGVTTFDVTGRVFGSFAHPNVFAFFVLFLFMLYTNYSTIEPIDFFKKHHHRTYLIAGYVLLIALLLQTFTRAAWIGLVAFLIIIGIMHYRKLLLSVLLGIVTFYAVFYPVNAVVRSTTDYDLQDIQIIARLTSRNEDADSFRWRQDLVRETAPLIFARPTLGYGYGTFPVVWETSRNVSHLFDDSAEAHNEYLRIALEIGFVGLGVYVLFLIRLLYIAIRDHWYGDVHDVDLLYLIAWIGVFILISLSDNMLHHTPIMWLMWSWWGALFAVKWSKRSGGGFIT